MSDEAKKITMEDGNKNIYIAMASSLRFPLNEIVAWAIFGDGIFVEDGSLLYSNYADGCLDTDLVNLEHLELMDNIEKDIKQYIDKSINDVDFSTINSAKKGITNILDKFLPTKYKELTSLAYKRNSSFKGFPIWWAALIIAYREMGIFAFKNGSYFVAIQLNDFCKECQSQAMFKNIAFINAYQKKLSERHKKNGSKGGSKKGVNYREPKEKALNYHDKHFSKQCENGKFIYSNAAAARKIVSHFDKIEQSLGYEDNSLANIISKHRKQHFTK